MKNSTRSTALVWLLAAQALATTSVLGGAAHAGDWSTVANSASVMPGGSGKLFSSFGQPSINNRCAIAFRGRSKGPQEPVRGVFTGNACKPERGLGLAAANGGVVPSPNNLGAVFNEFPALPRLDLRSNLVATRGQSRPVWEYTLPDGSDTRIGTSGVYAGLIGSPLLTGASLLGSVPGFEYFAVPGYSGVRFDQFPGAPSVFDGNKVAFKGNFTDGAVSRTGVFIRNLYLDKGKSATRRIADTQTAIPGTTTMFGSTAPPSAADGAVVFAGSDNEDAPTLGGIYRAAAPFYALKPVVTIGQASPDTPSLAFTKFGEGLSFDGQNIGFWAALGTETRTVRVHCPEDGNEDIVAACVEQCPDIDGTGHHCEQQVPVEQGFYVQRPNGKVRLVARAGQGQDFKDFVFWTFSGRPPGVGESDSEDFEPPRWRSSAFIAVSRNGSSVASAFKAVSSLDAVGVFVRPALQKSLTKLGVTSEMLQETVAHYEAAAAAMLEPVGSCTAYLQNMLTDGEAAKVRAAIVGKDMAEVQRLGMIARDRAASMDFKEVSDFLTKEERLRLRLRQQGTLITVDLPGVGSTSWANAVTNGLISFR